MFRKKLLTFLLVILGQGFIFNHKSKQTKENNTIYIINNFNRLKLSFARLKMFQVGNNIIITYSGKKNIDLAKLVNDLKVIIVDYKISADYFYCKFRLNK